MNTLPPLQWPEKSQIMTWLTALSQMEEQYTINKSFFNKCPGVNVYYVHFINNYPVKLN